VVRIFLESGLEVDFEKLKANVAMLRGEIDSLYELVEEAYHEGFKDGRDKGDKENTFWAWSESKVIEKLEK